MVRPSLNIAVAGTKNTASKYNENFTLMLDYLDGEITGAKNYVDGYMPSQTGQAGKFLSTNGTTASWSIPINVGTILYYGFTSAPSGWLICDGSAISRTTYSALFSAIGTTFGEGDGSTTFNLPNLIDKFPQGNTTVGTVKDAGLPNITGQVNKSCTEFSGCFYNTGVGGISTGYANYNQIGFDASKSNAIYGNSTTVQPPALTLLPIIKY